MNVMIIEDEQLAAEHLSRLIREVDPGITITHTVGTVAGAVELLNSKQPDLLFADIQLSDGSSFDVFEAVNVQCPVIFTTAYDEYALKAFKLHSIDYLLKPIKSDDIRNSLEKLTQLREWLRPDYAQLMKALTSASEPDYKKRFLVRYGSKIKKVEVSEIAYFYAAEKSVFMVTYAGAVYPSDHTLDTLETMINPVEFHRINRKMIVSFKSIKNMVPYSRSRIFLELDPSPPKGVDPLVSIERTSGFKTWMDT